jgi:hypothetical protein
VPPFALLTGLLAAGAAMGAVEPLLFVALVPATLYLLVRTTAYSYRVYAFSHPVAVYAALFVTLAVQAAVLLLYLGLTTDNGGLLLATADRLGLPIDPLGTIEIAGLTAPLGLSVAVAVPLALVAAYLAAQTVAALVVRLREPTIRPSRVRTGQRYPPWLEVVTSADRSTPTEPASDGSSSAETASANGGSAEAAERTATAAGSPSAGPTSAAGDTRAPDQSATASEKGDGDPSTGSTQSAGATPEADSVSNTRVFTPPDGTGEDPLAAVEEDGAEPCPACGTRLSPSDDHCPACGADALD